MFSVIVRLVKKKKKGKEYMEIHQPIMLFWDNSRFIVNFTWNCMWYILPSTCINIVLNMVCKLIGWKVKNENS